MSVHVSPFTVVPFWGYPIFDPQPYQQEGENLPWGGGVGHSRCFSYTLTYLAPSTVPGTAFRHFSDENCFSTEKIVFF